MYITYKQEVSNPKTGRIIGTIIGPGKEYGEECLTPNGQTWLFLAGAMSLDPTQCYVDIETQSTKPFEPMHLTVDKVEFIANNIDFATVSGIPSGAVVVVNCDGSFMQSCVVNDEGKLEIASENPASYEVQVSCFPYYPASITFKSVEPPVLPKGDGFAMSIMPDYSK